MQLAPIPTNEKERLASLYKLELLDTSPEGRFDIITKTATRIFHVPISTLTLIDKEREWYKSYQGIAYCEENRATSFCAHALVSKNIFVIQDTKKDERFADNPNVTGEPYIRFYAGVPIASLDGNRIGVFCIKDTKPRTFSKNDEDILKGLSAWVEEEINSHNVSLLMNNDKKIQSQLTEQIKNTDEEHSEQSKVSKAILNVMEDLEETRITMEKEKVKDEAMLASIGEGVLAVDNDGTILLLNKEGERILGYTVKELLGKKIVILQLTDEEGKLIPEEKRPATIAFSEKRSVNASCFFVKKNKQKFPISITVTPVKLKGRIIGLIEIFRDITREKAIDKAKNEFISLASHQLRTPLGISKWCLEALLSEIYMKKAPTEVGGYLDTIYKNNERVLALVRELLSVSRIDQGKVKNNPKQIDSVQVISDTIKEMSILAQKKEVELVLQIKKQKSQSIYLDPLRLHEVVENIVGNAIEYTDKSGKIIVSVALNKKMLEILVKDNGIGISDAEQKNLFTKFFRSANAVSHNPEGSGLGLYIVKSYVEGWGGTITVVSAEGKGTTVKLRIPVVQKKVVKN